MLGKKEDEGHLEFHSKLIPPYLRRAKDVAELIPWLYLRGVSTNDTACYAELVKG